MSATRLKIRAGPADKEAVGLYVLVVDDDELNRVLVERVLTARGIEVEASPNGIAALAAIERRRPDLIVLDVVMPGMSGADVLAQVKSTPRLATIPVIMLTARSGDDDLIASYRSGADYYLTKPLVADELLYGVALVLGRDANRLVPGLGSPMRARVARPR
jgi:two-component system, sensor histidine kinase ChiS